MSFESRPPLSLKDYVKSAKTVGFTPEERRHLYDAYQNPTVTRANYRGGPDVKTVTKIDYKPIRQEEITSLLALLADSSRDATRNDAQIKELGATIYQHGYRGDRELVEVLSDKEIKLVSLGIKLLEKSFLSGELLGNLNENTPGLAFLINNLTKVKQNRALEGKIYNFDRPKLETFLDDVEYFTGEFFSKENATAELNKAQTERKQLLEQGVELKKTYEQEKQAIEKPFTENLEKLQKERRLRNERFDKVSNNLNFYLGRIWVLPAVVDFDNQNRDRSRFRFSADATLGHITSAARMYRETLTNHQAPGMDQSPLDAFFEADVAQQKERRITPEDRRIPARAVLEALLGYFREIKKKNQQKPISPKGALKGLAALSQTKLYEESVKNNPDEEPEMTVERAIPILQDLLHWNVQTEFQATSQKETDLYSQKNLQLSPLSEKLSQDIGVINKKITLFDEKMKKLEFLAEHAEIGQERFKQALTEVKEQLKRDEERHGSADIYLLKTALITTIARLDSRNDDRVMFDHCDPQSRFLFRYDEYGTYSGERRALKPEAGKTSLDSSTHQVQHTTFDVNKGEFRPENTRDKNAIQLHFKPSHLMLGWMITEYSRFLHQKNEKTT
jgi:hypothetical protein